MSDMTLFEFPYTCISKQEYRWLLLTQNVLGLLGIVLLYAFYENRRARRIEASLVASPAPAEENKPKEL